MADAQSVEDIVPLGRLADWMDAQGLGTGPVRNPQLLAGGTQNILLRFQRAEKSGAREYVLRRPPRFLRKNSNDTMRREARVLKALAGSDVPHPGLIAACESEDVLGVAFYLMEPINGFNATVGLPPLHAGAPEIRRQMGFALMDGIAALSRIDPFAAGLEGFGKLDNYLERQASRWLSQLESYKELPGWPGFKGLPAVAPIVQWLEANRPSSFQPGIIHGDYHLANVLYSLDSAVLAAIVDWELCTLGDPLLDLAWVLAGWPDETEIAAGETSVKPWAGFPTADELVHHYSVRTGRDMSALDWYKVLACFKLGAILEGSHARAFSGKTPKDIGDRLHATTVRLFTRAHRLIEL
ncbi:MAG: phosphotransferase family protein [Alphaproteobacteria bacterium]|nr:phosphotransferase family protein [Alphaproteobacteria bacterium]